MKKISFVIPALFLLVLTVSVNAQQKVPQKLKEKAQIDGTVRILVELDVPWKPHPDLNSPEIRQQKNDIAAGLDQLLTSLAGTNHQVIARWDIIPGIALQVDSYALNFFENSPIVKSVTEDTYGTITLAQSVQLVEANLAWSAKFDGTGKTIAIVDTGVAGNHTFLTTKVVSEACYTFTSSCPNGLTSQTGTGSGVPCTFNATACAHGTRVAGIAAGRSTSFSGVARGAKLIAIQVGSNCGGAVCIAASDVISALNRVITLSSTYSIPAVNLSLFVSPVNYSDQATCDAQNSLLKAPIDILRAAGIATVVASGNDSLTQAMKAPACISSAISVGSTTKTDTISPFSNSTSFLSLVAPGGLLPSPDPSGINSSISPVPPSVFSPDSGTSFAAPHVAGAWAILKQKYPTASVGRVLGGLQITSLPIYDERDPSSAHHYVQCRIRIKKALDNFPNPLLTFNGPTGWSLGDYFGINKCQIAGSVTRNTSPFETRGFLLSGIGGSYTMFDVPNSTFTQGFKINGTGHIVGRVDIPSVPLSGFIRYPNGTFEAPITAFGSATMTVGINITGDVVGWWAGPPNPPQGNVHGLFRPFGAVIQTIDKPGAVNTDFYGINARPDMVGTYTDAQGFGHGFVRRAEGTFEDINCLGAVQTQTFGINDSGQIVGTYHTSTATSAYIRATDGTCTGFAVPNSSYTFPTSVNNWGMVVGASAPNNNNRGFVYNSMNQ